MCGARLDPETSVGHHVRQVFDLPEPAPLVVTEHRAHDCQCAVCGAKTRTPFPDGVNAPAQYGARIAAFVVYLLHNQLLPEGRLVELMADLLGVKLAAATIARMSRTCADRLRGFAETLRDLVAAAPVNRQRQLIGLIDLKLPKPAPFGAGWITAYRRWCVSARGPGADRRAKNMILLTPMRSRDRAKPQTDIG